MTFLKRLVGLATILFAILGLLLCLAAIAGIWTGKNRLDSVASAVFGTANEAFNFIEIKIDRASYALGRSRQRVSGFSKLAERLQAARAEESTDFLPPLLALDEVFRELQSAQDWLDSSEAVARGVNRVSVAIVQSQSEGSNEESAGMRAKKLAMFSDSVAKAIGNLQVIRQSLIDLREKRIVAREFASILLRRAADVDDTLADVSVRIGEFKTRLTAARSSSDDLGKSVLSWIFLAASILTLVLLWFGFSQLGMTRAGWRLARFRPKNTH